MLLVAQNGYENTVQAHLLSFAADVGGFGSDGGGPAVPTAVPAGRPTIRISYLPEGGLGQNVVDARLFQLCRQFSDAHIVVSGVDSTYQIDGAPIRDMAGATDEDELGGDTWIFVYYDVNDCDGMHYHVFDDAQNEIPFPPLAVLYHELAHAYHRALGDRPDDVDEAQVQAINDENGARSLLNMPLRSVIHMKGGCGIPGGSPAPSGGGGGKGGTYSNPWKNKCFVATAATGSPISLSVQRLTAFRDATLRTTELGRTLFNALFEEYYQFSPVIADDVRAFPDLRTATRRLCVDPLVTVLLWVQRLCLLPHEADEVPLAEEVSRVLSTSLQELATLGHDPARWAGAAEWLSAAAGTADPAPSEACAPSEVKGDDPDACARYLLGRASAPGIRLTYTGWGLLEPIALYWRWLVQQSAGNGPSVAHDVCDWLSRMPVPAALGARSRDERRTDLQALLDGNVRNPRAAVALRQVVSGCDG
jgi:hypothetical protein